MQLLKHVDVVSFAKVTGVFGVIAGLIIGLVALLFSALFSFIPGAQFIALGGLAMLIITPIINGIIGFAIGAVIAFLYNVIADAVGGIVVEVA